MRVPRTFLSLAILFLILIGSGTAQKKKPDPDEGYIPVVGPEDKKKKKGDEITQALPPPPELPAAVTADPTRLVYQVSPLSNKGLLSQQTRDALKALLKSNRGPIVKLRVFVAGSGDLRRISDIVGAAFQEKHQALPALSVAQVGALPMDGAQVVVEAAEVDRKETNPNGVAFLVGQTGATATEAIDKLKSVLTGAGMQSDDVLSATCFVSSLDEQRDTHQAMAATFPTAALDYVQMQRGPVVPAATCEAVARLRTVPAPNPAAAFVTGPQMVITGTQLAFGSQDSDLKLALGRLEKTLAASKASVGQIAVAHYYVTSARLSKRVGALESTQAANTVLPVESLPSLDAVFGLEVIAVPGP